MSDSREKKFKAADAKKLAGLSYRQLNDWESRGAMAGERNNERTWRKFNGKELFALMVCSEIRKRYGIPLEKIRFVRDFMVSPDRNHFVAALRLMQRGLSIYLLTDFHETFILDSDLEFANLMNLGYFRADNPNALIFLKLNDIVNRMLSALEEPFSLDQHDEVYRANANLQNVTTVKTQAELDVLQLVRCGEFDEITIKLTKDGGIREISSEGNVPLDEFSQRRDDLIYQGANSFETLAINRAEGKVIRVRRTIPQKYSKEDNQQVLFVARISAENQATET